MVTDTVWLLIDKPDQATSIIRSAHRTYPGALVRLRELAAREPGNWYTITAYNLWP